MAVKPSIPQWLEDKGILVTGATGFVGKVLVAKLLMSSPRGRNIYLLIREKKGMDPHDRLNALIQLEPFRVIREEHPERIKRLIVVSGDTTVEDLGVSTVDKDRLVEDVSVIFHMAANVRFDLPIRTAVTLNTKGAANIIAFAKQLPNLKSLIHVSTAFCHCQQIRLEEKAYAPAIPAEDIMATIDKMSDELLQPIESKLLIGEPNTYSLSKCLSEDLMVKSGLPVGVARPSIVTCSLKEPVPGWVDNINGPTGLMIGAGKGVIRSMLCNGEYRADVIPCDMVANATIALAWRVGLENPSTPIFVNVTEGGRNPMTWNFAMDTGKEAIIENPFSGPLWYVGGSITSSALRHWFAVLFFHTIPAFFIDALMLLIGNKPFLTKTQIKIASGLVLLQYYTTKNWIFVNDGLEDLQNQLCPEDREAFFMDTRVISWDDYIKIYVLGIRKYFLKEDPSTLPRARQVFKYLYFADIISRTIFVVLFGWFLYSWIMRTNLITASINDSKDL